MPKHTRHLARIDSCGDYAYGKQFKHGRAGRRTQQRVRRLLTRRRRAAAKRATRRTVADEAR